MKKPDAPIIFVTGMAFAVLLNAVAGAAVDTLSVLAGPKGQTGAVGQTGPTGDSGPQGPAGLPDYSGTNGIIVSGTSVGLAAPFSVTSTAIILTPPITTIFVNPASPEADYVAAKAVGLPIYKVANSPGDQPVPQTILCAGSDRVIGGGCVITPAGGGCVVTTSMPLAGNNGWTCDAAGGGGCQATAVAICVKTPP